MSKKNEILKSCIYLNKLIRRFETQRERRKGLYCNNLQYVLNIFLSPQSFCFFFYFTIILQYMSKNHFYYPKKVGGHYETEQGNFEIATGPKLLQSKLQPAKAVGRLICQSTNKRKLPYHQTSGNIKQSFSKCLYVHVFFKWEEP